MIGKKIIINDYKFDYEKAAGYLNVYAAFKITKKKCYIIYSYDNKKLYYGNFYVKNKIGTIMITEENDEIIKEFVYGLLDNKLGNNYQIIDLNYVDSIQIIDEKLCDFNVDMKKIYDITMPKDMEKVVNKGDNKKNKLIIMMMMLLIITSIGIYFYVNYNVIGDREYLCIKKYKHDQLPADVMEELDISFINKKVNRIKISTEYVFNGSDYYKNFKDNNLFYKYAKEGNTYKFEDDSYIYRVFGDVNLENISKREKKLIAYYKDNGYECNAKEE